MNAEYVAAMEDVLDLYAEAPDAGRPVVCFDEVPIQLIAETRQPVLAKPGQPERFDYEYQRNGTCNQFVFVEPAAGWRHVATTDHRTHVDFAQQMKWLADERYPEATVIRVVLDNLNTHRPASLYEAFAPAEAKRIWDRLEIHHTPLHGSWLNIAECEFSVLSAQCTNRRLSDQQALAAATRAWAQERNHNQAPVKWQFTTADARIQLVHLYPKLHD